jgi:hypothetical protein
MACPPRQPKRWNENGISPAVEGEISRIVKRLAELKPDPDATDYKPVVATLSPEAKAAWVEFYNRHGSEQATLSGELASAWAKLEETAARLALVIHYARWAAEASPAEFDDAPAIENQLFGDGAKAEPAPVAKSAMGDVLDAESVAAGVALVEWFKAEAVRVYAMLRESGASAERRRIVDWIYAKGGSVTARDVQRGCRWLSARGEAETALEELVADGVGHWESIKSGRKGHTVRRFRLAASGNGEASTASSTSTKSTVDAPE